ncbi:MAG TPA: M48 family metallopeptidase [Verrucomicrobiae bacterium]|nr:M48 family metallopeptidase [Verrucomicrobiae bacterium]
MHSTTAAVIVIALILLRLSTEQCLAWLNRRHVRRHADAVPESFRGFIDSATYAKSVRYTLARSRFAQLEGLYGTAVLLVILFSGVLPWAFQLVSTAWGESAWAMAAFLFIVGTGLAIPDLPLEWLAQFRLESRFGFNTTTQATWWLDRLKGLLLAGVLGYPLLVLVLKIVDWTGPNWWLWAWAVILGFQLVMMIIAPVLILPLFNRFTPLPEGSLRERLLKLADRTRFRAKSIEVMDGSKRSRHSNAFFTGLGGFRKIVLFDTLIQQLSEPELEAVLAHEIGHYRRKHIPRMLIVSAITSLAGFFVAGWLVRQAWFYQAFGFEPGNAAPALLLFALLSGVVTFWFSPLMHAWSRRHEYEADAFAREAVEGPDALIGTLRKLNEKNLSNLTPHPLYSGFYYSHPALLEREQALLAKP